MDGRAPMQLYTKILIGMALGVVAGLAVGPSGLLLTPDAVQLPPQSGLRSAPSADAESVPLAARVERARILDKEGSWVEVSARLRARDLLGLTRDGVEEAKRAKAGDEVRGWVDTSAPGVRTFARLGQGLVDWTSWLGRLFLALIKMVVVPLVFFSLTVGVASLGDFRRLGRLGGRTLLFFTLTTVIALTIGVGITNLVRPGDWLSPEDRAGLLASYSKDASVTAGSAADAPTFVDQIIAVVPDNPAASLAGGDMLQIIFFAVMFGIALTLLPNERSKPFVRLIDTANEAMVMLVHIAMKLAPVGVAALLFKVVGSTGLSVLLALGVYTLVVALGLLLHLVMTYGLVARFGAGLPITDFLRGIRPALLLAFSTSSSSATLPVTKECVEDNLAVSNQISSFVLPLGATVNMDGTALYQGVAAIFISQIYGMDLDLGQQLTIITSATLASVGAAGVPGAGLVTLAMVLTTVGVPNEGLALILGVDRLLDMLRTMTNVVGDSTATVLMSKLEGETPRLLTAAEDRADPSRGFEGRVETPRAVDLGSD